MDQLLAEIREELSRALRNNDVHSVHLHHTMISYIETKQLLAKLQRFNLARLREIIDYLKEKKEYLENKLTNLYIEINSD